MSHVRGSSSCGSGSMSMVPLTTLTSCELAMTYRKVMRSYCKLTSGGKSGESHDSAKNVESLIRLEERLARHNKYLLSLTKSQENSLDLEKLLLINARRRANLNAKLDRLQKEEMPQDLDKGIFSGPNTETKGQGNLVFTLSHLTIPLVEKASWPVSDILSSGRLHGERPKYALFVIVTIGDDIVCTETVWPVLGRLEQIVMFEETFRLSCRPDQPAKLTMEVFSKCLNVNKLEVSQQMKREEKMQAEAGQADARQKLINKIMFTKQRQKFRLTKKAKAAMASFGAYTCVGKATIDLKPEQIMAQSTATGVCEDMFAAEAKNLGLAPSFDEFFSCWVGLDSLRPEVRSSSDSLPIMEGDLYFGHYGNGLDVVASYVVLKGGIMRVWRSKADRYNKEPERKINLRRRALHVKLSQGPVIGCSADMSNSVKKGPATRAFKRNSFGRTSTKKNASTRRFKRSGDIIFKRRTGNVTSKSRSTDDIPTDVCRKDGNSIDESSTSDNAAGTASCLPKRVDFDLESPDKKRVDTSHDCNSIGHISESSSASNGGSKSVTNITESLVQANNITNNCPLASDLDNSKDHSSSKDCNSPSEAAEVSSSMGTDASSESDKTSTDNYDADLDSNSNSTENRPSSCGSLMDSTSAGMEDNASTGSTNSDNNSACNCNTADLDCNCISTREAASKDSENGAEISTNDNRMATRSSSSASSAPYATSTRRSTVSSCSSDNSQVSSSSCQKWQLQLIHVNARDYRQGIVLASFSKQISHEWAKALKKHMKYNSQIFNTELDN